MKNKLEEINSIEGVRGSFFFFHDGEVVYDKMPPGMDQDTLSEIAKEVVQISAILDRLTVSIGEFDLKYDNGRLLAYAQPHYCVIILCEPGAGLAMLRLTVNVAIADLEADKKFQKRIAKIETTRRSFLVRSNMDADSWKLVETIN